MSLPNVFAGGEVATCAANGAGALNCCSDCGAHAQGARTWAISTSASPATFVVPGVSAIRSSTACVTGRKFNLLRARDSGRTPDTGPDRIWAFDILVVLERAYVKDLWR